MKFREREENAKYAKWEEEERAKIKRAEREDREKAMIEILRREHEKMDYFAPNKIDLELLELYELLALQQDITNQIVKKMKF